MNLMTEIRDLKTETKFIQNCPVLMANDFGDPIRCNEPLYVLHTHTIVGDDYGSWPTDSFYFVCGHTFEDMVKSERVADQI